MANNAGLRIHLSTEWNPQKLTVHEQLQILIQQDICMQFDNILYIKYQM